MKNYISINITYIRKKFYYSQKELANKYSLSQNAIGTYERGISYPTIQFIQQFCKDFEVNIDDFINLDLAEHEKAAPIKNTAANVDTNYEKLLTAKDEIIKSKELVVAEKDKQIKLLEKHNAMLDTLLNQSKVMQSIEIIRKINDEIDSSSSE